jgi:hypothetical protein
MDCQPITPALFKIKFEVDAFFVNQVDQLATLGRQMIDVEEDHINGLTSNNLRGFPAASSKLQVFGIPSALLLLLPFFYSASYSNLAFKPSSSY